MAKRFDPSQHFEQSRLPCPIGTNQPKPFSLRDVQIKIGEQGADPKVFRRIHQADQTHGLSAETWASR